MKFVVPIILIWVGVGLAHASQQEGAPRRMGFGPGPMVPDLEITKTFDGNRDGWLSKEERLEARKALPELREAARKRSTKQGPRPDDRMPPGDPERRRLAPPGPPSDGLPPPGFGPPDGPRGPGFGPPGGMGRNREPAAKGPQVSLESVPTYPDRELYDPSVFRTIFIHFTDSDDWEQELADFKNTDVEVPADLLVDGQRYTQVGIKFRGNSSFMMTPATYKRSLNLSLDLVNKDQRLYGYKTLNLLNAAGDPSLMSAVVYSALARKFTAAPKANLVKVVINGESWGIYENVQQFNKDFLEENLGVSKGARWKVPGRPGGDGGLRYQGEDIEAYRQNFEIKTADKQESWASLINLCKVLNETPIDELPAAIEPILNVDGALWFLANDVATSNSDGYWTRASDYNIYLDPEGKFHIFPYDMNEAFIAGHGPPGGPGGRGFAAPFRGPGVDPAAPGDADEKGQRSLPKDRQKGSLEDLPQPPNEVRPSDGERPPGRGPQRPGGPQGGRGPRGPGAGGPKLDPLIGLDDPSKPLRSKLLAVPQYRERYLQHVRSIATFGMEAESVDSLVNQLTNLIQDEVGADTKKLTTLEAFQKAVGVADSNIPPETASHPEPNAEKTLEEKLPENARIESLREFFAQRRSYLLSHPEIKKLEGPPEQPAEQRGTQLHLQKK